MANSAKGWWVHLAGIRGIPSPPGSGALLPAFGISSLFSAVHVFAAGGYGIGIERNAPGVRRIIKLINYEKSRVLAGLDGSFGGPAVVPGCGGFHGGDEYCGGPSEQAAREGAGFYLDVQSFAFCLAVYARGGGGVCQWMQVGVFPLSA